MPLDILLGTMRQRWGDGQVIAAEALAKATAPYVHAKPASRRDGGLNLDAVSDEKLDELCGLIGHGTDAEVAADATG